MYFYRASLLSRKKKKKKEKKAYQSHAKEKKPLDSAALQPRLDNRGQCSSERAAFSISKSQASVDGGRPHETVFHTRELQASWRRRYLAARRESSPFSQSWTGLDAFYRLNKRAPR